MVFVPLVSVIVYPLALISFVFPFLNPVFNILIALTNTLSSIFTKLSIFINIPKVSILFIFLLYIFILLFKYNKRYILYLLITILIIKHLKSGGDKTLPLTNTAYYNSFGLICLILTFWIPYDCINF